MVLVVIVVVEVMLLCFCFVDCEMKAGGHRLLMMLLQNNNRCQTWIDAEFFFIKFPTQRGHSP